MSHISGVRYRRPQWERSQGEVEKFAEQPSSVILTKARQKAGPLAMLGISKLKWPRATRRRYIASRYNAGPPP